MSSRDPIVGSNTKKRPIHPYLKIWKDTRKTIEGDGIPEIRTKPSNSSRDIELRVFCFWGTSENTLVEVLGPKQLLLYLIRAARVSFDSQPMYTRSTLHTRSQNCIRRPIPTYAQRLVETHSPLF